MSVKKIIYFHENQLTYPVRKQSSRNMNQIDKKEQRDFQYGKTKVKFFLGERKEKKNI